MGLNLMNESYYDDDEDEIKIKDCIKLVK